MHDIPQAEHQDFILQNIPPAIINHNISLFLEYRVGIIRQEWSLEADWPGEVVLRQLVLRACGLFIWAATACRFINEGEEFAEDRLGEILGGTGFEGTPEQHLDQIYLTVLQHSIPNTFRAAEKVQLYARQRNILGSIAILLSPLPAASVAKLISISGRQVTQTLERLQAILAVPKDTAGFLRLHHPSFRDFLLNKDRCGHFWVDEKEAHRILAAGCIQLMSQTLKKDICEMHAPGSQASQVESSWLEKCLPPEIQYACLYWVQHLQRSCSQVHNGGEAHQFLQAHLLHWLEALGWMGKISEGIQAILALEAHVLVCESPALHAFIHDARRFAVYNRLVIEQAPLQSYCSALIFAPEKSIIRETFEECIPTWIERKPRVQAHWSAALQTLEGHSKTVNSVAFSPDGKQVASGSDDQTVRLWDTATGAVLQTLKGHLRWVKSVAFSPNGRQVVSGSGDKTLRLWDTATGEALQTLKGHLDWVNSVAFLPDGRIVSGSHDQTVRFWDGVTGVGLHTLKGHLGFVHSVAFSCDGRIVSGSGDQTVRLWDAATGVGLQTLKGHSDHVTSVAFSPDGRVVSGSDDRTVRLWDSAAGVGLQTIKGHSSSVTSVTFSTDGRQVLSGSSDKTVRLWDAVTREAPQTLNRHSSLVTSAAFSTDSRQVLSISGDRTVSVYSVAFSPNGRQVVSGSGDKMVRLWDTATGAVLQTLKGHLRWVKSVAFSPNGRQVVSGSGDRTVRLWDVTTGAALQTLEGHSDSVNSVAFSPDGRQVLSSSYDNIIRLWDTATGVALQTLEGHSGSFMSVTSLPDSKVLPTLHVFNNWLKEGTTNFLWLPTDYRPTCEAVRDRLVILGHSSGEISFLQIKLEPLLITPN